MRFLLAMAVCVPAKAHMVFPCGKPAVGDYWIGESLIRCNAIDQWSCDLPVAATASK
ncbi:MAG: hypothetical protein GKS01_12420 [Alphaproteobacteria bacterium]|nr:hypothetical protein [Alphaproteobacteria bacterium]